MQLQFLDETVREMARNGCTKRCVHLFDVETVEHALMVRAHHDLR
jgi:hypothetical protein